MELCLEAKAQRPGGDLADVAVHLLGMIGETGSVATEYKKLLRDGPAHTASKARFREELGDVLWVHRDPRHQARPGPRRHRPRQPGEDQGPLAADHFRIVR